MREINMQKKYRRDDCNRSPYIFFLKIQTSQFPVIRFELKSVFKILEEETEQLFLLMRNETLC